MNIQYKHSETNLIRDNIIRIETTKRVLELIPQLPHIEKILRRQSLLKSSLFSAKIEGNTLKLNEIRTSKFIQADDKQQLEVNRILQTMQWIYAKHAPRRISVGLIRTLHAKTMQSLTSQAGKFRTEPSAIFNTAGVAMYVTPPPTQIQNLLEKLIGNNLMKKDHEVIKTAFTHFSFEKIHPFLDGNGRVGRLLSVFMLKNSGYDFRGIAVLEQYLSENRQMYYDALSTTKMDITEFIEFFTSAIAESAEKVIDLLKYKNEEVAEDTLLPRRREIVLIIREHRVVTFDFLKRRFLRIPDSTLHYDIKMLLKAGFIKKLGKTRGSLYSPIEVN